MKGERHAIVGDYAYAVECFTDVLDVARKWRGQFLESLCLMRLGDMSWNMGRMTESKRLYEDSLTIARNNRFIKNVDRNICLLEIHRLYSKGKELRDSGKKYQDSIIIFNQAISLARNERSLDHECKCLRQLSSNYYQLQDYDRFYEINLTANKIANITNNRREIGYSHNNIGLYHYKRFNYSEALRFLNLSMKYSRSENEKQLLSESSTNIATVFYDMGDYDMAREFIEKTIKLDMELNNSTYYAIDLCNLGNIFKKKKMFVESINILADALFVSWECGDKNLECAALNNIGDCYIQMGKNELALKVFRKAYREAVESQNQEMESLSLNNIANIFLLQKKIDMAIKYYRLSLSKAKSVMNEKILWDVYYGIGRCYFETGEMDNAELFFRKGIETIEVVRSHIDDDVFKISFNRNKYQIYEKLIELLLIKWDLQKEEKINSDIFFFIEKAKSRIFLETLENKQSVHTNTMNEDYVNEKGFIKKKRNEDELINEIEEGRKKRDGNFSFGILSPSIVKIAALQNEILAEDTAIVEYFLGENNSVMILITRSYMEIHQIPAKNAIEKATRGYAKYISSRTRYPDVEKNAGKKILNEIKFPFDVLEKNHIKKIVIIPDGFLYFLPFETLIIEKGARNEMLIDKFQISYAPSSSVLYEMWQRRNESAKKHGLLGIGNPLISEKANSRSNILESFPEEKIANNRYLINSIPYTKNEIRFAASLFPINKRVLFEGIDANERNIKNLSIKNFQIIHFACHGILDGNIPLRSALILSKVSRDEDDLLQVSEIFDSKLAANLVILSACQTGKGNLELGEGVMGLPRAFFFNGSSSVLSTLWRISDKPAALFMKKYYEFLYDGFSKAGALRKTKLYMRQTKYRDPYYWAGFVLLGEGESPIVFQ